ncbi:probable sodium/potassium/calcium exchanger CG1090 [Biomphalaria glabrata]|uniref:Probable sodium/potassium/calcium exchanger CG1090 n=1 Tax=Biomphalaria glabrata TaxID=6526 RepID=A0A9W2YAY9_BIOGL|nr:probable sodium/potassium/calcium exchanger CG1090 [Biomphalaria glabrata]XP_055859908.1 probable sodium/potassium/calcium exchanger CG1090 [Biomphalaria glabrata]XP_055859911.1 probable sodium/potassium/calcium exchanger CG1090 [Biomphalaria glabrata]
MLPRRPFRLGVALLWAGAMVIGLRGAGYIGTLLDIPSVVQRTGVDSEQPQHIVDSFPLAGHGYGTEHFSSSRHLLSLQNCTPRAVEQFPRDYFSQSQRSKGAIVLHIILVAYMFLALAIVCDSYFVPALEVLCELLHLQTDVAGATFMAAGSSAPELATALIGVFIAKDDVGLSTVVGSAIYNVMFVISVCGFAAGVVVQLNWWPLVRDSLAYLISIAALILVIADEVVTWYESVLFLVLYILYIVFMFFNQRLEKYIVPKITCCPKEACSVPDQVVIRYEKMDDGEPCTPDETTRVIMGKDGSNASLDSNSSADDVATEIHKTVPEETIWHVPAGRWSCLLWAVSLPLSILMYFTVPDCRRERLRKWFLVTFIMSLVWLSVFSFLMVWMITIIGFTFNIPDSVMSLTFVAFGVSLPDVVASVLVMKDGLGDMAVSNAVGSNVFDILVCLGIPWFIQTSMLHPGSTVQVYSEGLVYASITLLSTVALLVIIIHLNKWTLDRRVSIIFMVIYIGYTLLAALYELNIFGYFHPSECESDY